MAAYAALVSVMQILDQIQTSSLPPISIDASQLQSLTQKVAFLQEFLEGYSSHVGYTEEADPMESRIADAAYAAEDVIESYIVDQILSRSTSHGEEINSIEFYQSLQTVIDEMELIEVEALEIKEKKGVRDQLHMIKSATHAGSSVRVAPKSPITVGIDDVLYQMLDKITGEQLNRQIIPIVGMGGIGKTTLARNIYVNPLVKEHFDVCAWSTISQQHNSLEILKQVLAQVKKGDCEDFNENELGEQLYKQLIGRRYMIVMDDMWSIEAWEGVRWFFPDNGNGSRIIVTTRLSNLALKFDYCDGLDMKLLDEASSWSLFSKTVFGEETCPLELEDIGKRIVEGCGGLPLSIVVIGGLLSKTERTPKEWESVGENVNSIVNMEGNESCLQLLYLSYNNLPIYVKPCFLYMAYFEEVSEIPAPLLVILWVAEGFIKPLIGKSLEEAAEEYLEELVDRNLILVEKRNHCGKLKLLKIHDLLRDLGLREARKVKFLCVLEEKSIHVIPQDLHTQRRIHCTLLEFPSEVLESLGNASVVRSIDGRFPKTLLSNFRMLRIPMCNDEMGSGKDCEEVFLGLVNLRVIVAGEIPFPNEIPSSIYFFWNLQILILDDCKYILEIWKLPQLRHVMTFSEGELCLPCPTNAEDIVVLRNLHTLSTVINLICGEDVVSRVPNIKNLKLYYDEEFMEASPGLNNLRHLHKLETLAIGLHSSCDSRLVHNLSFPHSLKWLTLENTRLQWEDMNTKIGQLPLLQVLKLKRNSFIGSEWETLEGQFCSLKFLKIVNCDLEQWVTDYTHFPRLQHLVLDCMPYLSEIPSSMGDIPTLRSIELDDCSESAVDSAKRIQEEQEDYGNTDLKLRLYKPKMSKLRDPLRIALEGLANLKEALANLKNST